MIHFLKKYMYNYLPQSCHVSSYNIYICLVNIHYCLIIVFIKQLNFYDFEKFFDIKRQCFQETTGNQHF